MKYFDYFCLAGFKVLISEGGDVIRKNGKDHLVQKNRNTQKSINRPKNQNYFEGDFNSQISLGYLLITQILSLLLRFFSKQWHSKDFRKECSAGFSGWLENDN